MPKARKDRFLLGPFFDVDPARSEIIPVGFEEAEEPLSLCMGRYKVRSNEPALHGSDVHITNKDVTAFIQADWDRVFGTDKPNRGFLLAYRAGAFAAGRVAEELVLRKLLTKARFRGGAVVEYLLFSEAQERSLVLPRKGSQSDDLVLCLENGDRLIVESKAAFAGKSYLSRSVPKAVSQLSATLERNSGLSSAALCLIDLTRHSIAIATMNREEAMSSRQALIERIRDLTLLKQL
ncbi:MAG: hypothetical protein JSS72_08695 [Armatimonadetes bacterium]|nr:hypothetical protein [Armatimonadota bacterium]